MLRVEKNVGNQVGDQINEINQITKRKDEVPYKVKGKCVYKKDTGKKVGCTDGPIEDYLAALHANANESMDIEKEELKEIILNVLESLEDNYGHYLLSKAITGEQQWQQ